MISYTQALEIIHREFQELSLETESVNIHSAIYRTLAQDSIADIDFPPFSNSAVDGYAVVVSENIRSWNVIDEITAGHFHEIALDEHSAVSIMTGAKIPDGASAVIPIEDVDVHEKNITLRPSCSIKVGMNIRRQGEDCVKGTIVLPKGTQIQANHIPILSACGYETVNVLKQLRFGIVVTGDELISMSEKPAGDKLRATNGESLVEQIKQLHQRVSSCEILQDDEEKLSARMQSLLHSDEHDILLTTGGVSVGAKDYVQKILRSLGAEIHFWKASIKPGKPILFASIIKGEKKKFIFGLPGNPVSVFVNFKIFIEPAVQKIFRQQKQNIIFAELTAAEKKHDEKRHFLRGVLEIDETQKKYFVRSIENQSSGNMFGLGLANCLIVFKEERMEMQQGETAECILI
ncbi:MAG: molybdopterin molybdotransferase MoeA [Bacteroidetes bacterium]|nr:molybdopterin molybdotransferase MoeA [Bacteroidota bacterium]